jgi:hypothetical protein
MCLSFLPWEKGGSREKDCLSCLCSFLSLIAFTLVKQISTLPLSVCCATVKDKRFSSAGELPKLWGGDQDMSVSLVLEAK